MTRPTKAAAEDMKTWYILFSCPVVSADLKPPLCEMTPIPDQNSSDAHAWTEVTYPGDDIFPGRACWEEKISENSGTRKRLFLDTVFHDS